MLIVQPALDSDPWRSDAKHSKIWLFGHISGENYKTGYPIFIGPLICVFEVL